MEGISVLHDEFAATHQAKARANFVSEFVLNLIEGDGELAVGTQQFARQGGDDLFMGGTQTNLASLAILEVKHDSLASGVALPAATAFPQF